MTLTWLYKRLQRMGTREIGHRIGEGFRARLQGMGIGNARPRDPSGEESLPWVAPLPKQFAVNEYRQAANAILGGEFQIFALSPCRIGFPPEWNRDPKSGTRAPLIFGKALNYRLESLVGNIKYLWEPNRHLETVTLAQAWHLSGDERYALGCRELVDSWIEQCPYPLGVNWSSTLELGIRLTNWSFAWQLLGGEGSPIFSGHTGERFRRRWLTAVYQHCHFVDRYPSLYSSANNHLLGEMLGLLVASLTWPKWTECAAWRNKAHRTFERQALAQNSADGVNREQAVWYHHEVLDMMIIAALVGRASGLEFSAEYWQRIESMLEFTASLMDIGGNMPAFGDSDDAVVVRFCPARDFPVFRSQLATGAVLFKRGDFGAIAGAFDEKSRWLLGDSASSSFDDLAKMEHVALPRRAFAEGGYYVLGCDFGTSREVKVVVDAGPLGYLSIAAHGHADALAFTLSAGGEEILIDPGTYSYHTEPEWRSYFRGTSAHNTIRLDGQDQSVSGGNFMWIRHAHAICEKFEVTETRQTLAVSHDGYCRLADPVVHHRDFEFCPAECILRIVDTLNAARQHRVEMHLHVSESCQVTMHRDHALVVAGKFIVEFTWPALMQARLARGEEAPPLGWISRRFDQRRPCSTIVVSGYISGNWSGESKFRMFSALDLLDG